MVLIFREHSGPRLRFRKLALRVCLTSLRGSIEFAQPQANRGEVNER